MQLTFVIIFSLICHIHGFNYMDYANLYNGEVHLHTAKIAGHLSWELENTSRAWEFLGIRYAIADRFQPPKIVEDFDNTIVPGVRVGPNSKALLANPGPACIQNPDPKSESLWRINATSEDCLFLNIYLPQIYRDHALLRKEPWPVLLYIHGGNFEGGAGHTFNGSELARNMDIVVITINYRVGIFGFLSTEDFNAPGNWGLKDAKIALKWIHQYIGRFGADSSRIVLSGQNSGAVMVSLLIMDHEVRGMISGAIQMGGSSLHRNAIIASPYSNAVMLADILGCSTNSTSKLISCLRDHSAAKLLDANNELDKKSDHTTSSARWLPSIDVDNIPYNPIWILRSGAWEFEGSVLQSITENGYEKKFPVMETELVLKALKDRLKLEVPGVLACETQINSTVLDQVMERFVGSRNNSNTTLNLAEIISQFENEVNIRLPALQEASEFAKNSLLTKRPKHHYQIFDFKVNGGSCGFKHDENVAIIGVESAYLFFPGSYTRGSTNNAGNCEPAKQLRQFFAAFIKERHTFGLPYDPKTPQILRLGQNNRWNIVNDGALSDLMNFWERLRDTTCVV